MGTVEYGVSTQFKNLKPPAIKFKTGSPATEKITGVFRIDFSEKVYQLLKGGEVVQTFKFPELFDVQTDNGNKAILLITFKNRIATHVQFQLESDAADALQMIRSNIYSQPPLIVAAYKDTTTARKSNAMLVGKKKAGMLKFFPARSLLVLYKSTNEFAQPSSLIVVNHKVGISSKDASTLEITAYKNINVVFNKREEKDEWIKVLQPYTDPAKGLINTSFVPEFNTRVAPDSGPGRKWIVSDNHKGAGPAGPSAYI